MDMATDVNHITGADCPTKPPEEVMVTVPEGVAPGTLMEAKMPSGQVVHVACPEGMSAGQQFKVELEHEAQPDGPAVQKVRAQGIIQKGKWDGGIFTGYGDRMDAVKEIKSTAYEAGTIGHITQHPMQYSFMERTKAAQMLSAGKPLDTMTDFTPKKGCCVLL